MPPLTINVFVSPRAAILAGKTVVGAASVTIQEGELAELSEPLRLELALAYESNQALGKVESEPPVVEPTLAALKPLLEWRAARRGVVETERRLTEARATEAAAAEIREVTAKDNARSRALRKWIEDHGDDEQKARMAEGYLPETEILEDVCEELLDLPGFRVYDPLRRGDACDCACAGSVVFTSGAPTYMDARQFAKLVEAREAVPEGAMVEAVEHKARCPACACVPIARLEARVTMNWNHWRLVRQYALT